MDKIKYVRLEEGIDSEGNPIFSELIPLMVDGNHIEIGDKTLNMYLSEMVTKTELAELIKNLPSGGSVGADGLDLGNGYYLNTEEIDDATMHQAMVHATENEYNIFTLKAPEDHASEATLSLLAVDNSHCQFVDFSCMKYNENEAGTVCIINQTRGGTPLPHFYIGYNNGSGGRVQKFMIEPDSQPIKLTSTGISIRRDNSYSRWADSDDTIELNWEDLANGIEGSNTNIPTYVEEEAQRVIDTVREHQNYNCFTFIAMSDSHVAVSSSETTSYANTLISTEHAGMGAGLIRKSLPIDAFVALGDITWGGSKTTILNATKDIEYFNKSVHDAAIDIDNFRTVGNHDPIRKAGTLNNGYIRNTALYPLIGKFNCPDLVIDPLNKAGGYGYKDYPEYKLRIILLNTADDTDNDYTNDYGSHINRVSSKQYKWFAETALPMGIDKQGWRIIIFSHHPLDWGTPAGNLTKILKAYVEGDTIDKTMGKEDLRVFKDYSQSNYATILANIHGHLHNYRQDKIKYVRNETTTGIDLPIDRFAIPNVCFYRSNEYGEPAGDLDSNDIEFGDSVTYNKTINTGQDTAFCVVTLDFENNHLYLHHYGAGIDRDMEFPVIEYPHPTYETHEIPTVLEAGSISLTDGSYKNSGTSMTEYMRSEIIIDDLWRDKELTYTSDVVVGDDNTDLHIMYFDANDVVLTEYEGKNGDYNDMEVHLNDSFVIPAAAKKMRIRIHNTDLTYITLTYKELVLAN